MPDDVERGDEEAGDGGRGTAASEDPTRRAVRYGAIQTAIVAFLAGAFGMTTLFDPLDLGHEFMAPRLSGYGAQLAQSVVALFAVTALALFVLLPFVVAGFRLLDGDDPLRSVVGWWFAGVTVPAVVLGQLWGLRLDWRAGTVTVALFAALLGTCWYLIATDRESPGAAALANHVLIVLVATAALAGPVAGFPLGAHGAEPRDPRTRGFKPETGATTLVSVPDPRPRSRSAD